MKKIIISIAAIALFSSSLLGEDAFYAHINQEDEKLIEVNQDNKKIHDKDEILKITPVGIYLYSHAVDAKNETLIDTPKEIKRYSKDVSNALVCSSHPNEESQKTQSILCQSIFVSWKGGAGSILVNAIYSPLSNIVFGALSLGRTTFQKGYVYFADIDYEKIRKFSEDNNLQEYQLKLISKY